MNIGAASGNTYNASASANKGFSGLVSGLDTDSMVEALLASAQAKIDKQTGIKQQTLWKQEIYRSIIGKLNTFQSKYFSTSSSTSLLNQTFFNLMNAATQSTHFKVTATSSASVGTTKVRVDRLATNSKLTSGEAVSGKLEGDISQAKLDKLLADNLAAERKVTFKVGSDEVEVDFTDIFVDGSGNYTAFSESERGEMMAARINDTLGNKGVTATAENGTLKIVGSDNKSVRVTGASTDAGLKAIGLTAGQGSSSSVDDTTLLTSKFNTKNEITFDVSLDDNKKTISINLEAIRSGNSVDLGLLETELQTKINKAHGNNQIAVTVDTVAGTVNLASTKDGRKVLVGGDLSVLGALGYKNGQSNRIGMGGTLSQQAFNTPLQGSTFAFTINGVDFKFSDSATMSEVVNKINGSDAGVRVVYKALEDKFVMEASDSGEGFEITMSQSEGNLLSAMFGGGIASGNTVTSGQLTRTTLSSAGLQLSGTTTIDSGTFKIKVGGTAYEIKLPERDDGADPAVGIPYTWDEARAEINTQLKEALGNEDIQLLADGSLTNVSGKQITIESTDLADKIGLGGATSVADENTLLSDLGITSITGTIGDLVSSNAYGGTFTLNGGKLTFEAGAAGNFVFGDADATRILFGAASISLGQDSGALAYEYKPGENALVEIDGVLTERSSNNFTINGLNFELKSVTTGTDAEEINVSRGTDQIVDGIKNFMNDYNDLIAELNDLIRADATYKKYAPLTDAQKKEMSEREIELWEEKAKEGLLKGDSAISSLLNSMRSILYERPAGGIALYELGIETSSDWKDNGKLVFSADGEAKLRQAIERNPDEVLKLFTDPEEGLSVKMEKALMAAANTSSANQGSLVRIAGVQGKASDTTNDLYNRLKTIDAKIAALKRAYETQRSRYWRQFNAMEAVISNMNSQSSWLSMQMGQ